MRFRIILLAIILLCFAAKADANYTYTKTVFYIVAHPDDWQLFMGDRVFNDAIDTNTNVIIIHTTAGDASCGRQVNKQYYRARENGAINSLEFCADIHSNHRKSRFDTLEVNTHPLRRFSNKNVSDYFMMMPDGCMKCGWKNQSLEYLFKRQIAGIQTVDSANTYTDWNDLVGTIKSIITSEAATGSAISINVADVDAKTNPGDHPDHLYTALAALQAVKDMNDVTINLFTGYYTSKLPANLRATSIALKGALFALADFGITQNNINTTWFNHQEFLDKTYYRTITTGSTDLVRAFTSAPAIENMQVSPNPMLGPSTINFDLLEESLVDIKIYDLRGKIVENIMDGKKPRGHYTNNINVSSLAKGKYIVFVQTPSFKDSIHIEIL